jgi:hypothetical protein
MEKEKDGTPNGDAKATEASNRVRSYIALALVVVAAAMLVVWLASGDDDSDSGSGEANVVSTDELRDAAEDRETPVYWAGERQGTELELSEPDADRAYVRYLTEGAAAGDTKPDYLTVGTYASDDPIAELRKQGKEPGGVLGTAPGGAVVYFNRSEPLSVYIAYPGVDAQIEVYDPAFNQALRLVNAGQVVPVD